MGQFVQHLLVCLSSTSLERDHCVVEMKTKQMGLPFACDSSEYMYMQVLTPYALSFVVKALREATEVKVEKQGISWMVKTPEGREAIDASAEDCKYCFHKAIGLPAGISLPCVVLGACPSSQKTLCQGGPRIIIMTTIEATWLLQVWSNPHQGLENSKGSP